MDITNVDSLRDNGPLGSNVSGFWNSKKLADDQLHADPNDKVNKLPENCVENC